LAVNSKIPLIDRSYMIEQIYVYNLTFLLQAKRVKREIVMFVFMYSKVYFECRCRWQV